VGSGGQLHKAISRCRELLLRSTGSRLTWLLLAPLLLVGLFFFFQARFGFNPTDDGFVLNQAWRLANGDLPHVDFSSPRPLGSAFLHYPIVFLESHMLAASRILVLFQQLWIAFALVDGFSRLSHAVSPFSKFGFVAISFLLNVGTWPVMAWHTVDGIFLAASALWLATLTYQKPFPLVLQWSGVWLLAGFAVLVKQPFLVVPILVSLLITGRTWKPALGTLPLALVGPTFYFVLFGGLDGQLLPQLYSGSGQELFQPLRALVSALFTAAGLFAIFAVVASVVLSRLMKKTAPILQVVPGLAAGAFGLLVAHYELMPIKGLWPFIVTLMFVVASFLTARRLRERLFAASTLGLGFAASLSWGVPAPSLLAGSYLALTVYLILNLSREKRDNDDGWSFSTGVALLATAAVLVSGYAREANVYREPSKSQLLAEVRHPNFAGIRVSPQSASYVESVMRCSRNYPAQRMAVIPDNPGLYPLLGLKNPFPVDWWLREEQPADHSERVRQVVEGLNIERGYLVLFQTFSAQYLSDMSKSEIQNPDKIFVYNEADSLILSSLEGSKVACASFVGKYEPAP